MNTMILQILVSLLLVFKIAFCQEWEGCVDPLSTNDSKVKKGQQTQVCFTTGPGGDWGLGVTYQRYSFRPVADQYSRFTVPDSYNSLIQKGDESDITIFTASQKSLSFLRKYHDSNYGIFPHLTAIVDVKDGIVQGIAWDDACIFCSNNRCEENTFNFNGSPASLAEPTKGCYLTKEQCDTIHSKGGTDCNLTIYVVWTGTDLAGNYLTSSNKRFSSFQPKQIQDFVKDSVTGLIPTFDFGNFFRT